MRHFDANNTDNLNKTFLNSCKSIGLIILLITYQLIPVVFLNSFGFNYNNLSVSNKIIFLFITNVLFILFLVYIYRSDLKRNWENFWDNPFYILKTAIKYWLIGLAIMIVFNLFISIINGGGIANNEKAVRELLKKAPIYMFFQISIYAPFTEEIIFRKSIRDIFNNPIIYILVSGLVFGGMHVLNDFSDMTDLLYIFSYGSLGCVFAALYNKTDNIFSSMSVHSIHNTLAFLLLLISGSIK